MLLERDWNQGGAALPPRGGQRPSTRDVLNPLHGLTVAEVKALPADEYSNGMRLVTVDGKRWRFSSTSALTTDGDQLLIVPTGVATGRWLAETNQVVDIVCPIAFGTADAAILYTVPTGAIFQLEDLLWEVTADFTGGASSAIGVSSSNKTTPTNWTTKGDLLGGATGDVLATLVATSTILAGTVGADMDTVAKRRGAIFKPTDTFRFDRITSAFTAGTGNVHIIGKVLANAGA